MSTSQKPTRASSASALRLEAVAGVYVVCRLPADAPIPDFFELDGPVDPAAPLRCMTQSDVELSIVVEQRLLPDTLPAGLQVEGSWIAVRVVGALEFGLLGIIARLSTALAEAMIPLLAISTFDTDYLLLKRDQRASAIEALARVADVSSLQ